jgi:hypothetical protein
MALTNNGVFSHCLPLRRNVKPMRSWTGGLHRHRRGRNRLRAKAVMSALIESNN